MTQTTSLSAWRSGQRAAIVAFLGLLVAWAAWTPASAQTATTFQVTITNTTSPAMPISPGAYLLATTPDTFWVAGGTASLALERIAEVGDPAEAASSLGATMIDAAGATGDMTSFEVEAMPGDLLSFASMLVGSNDGYVGVNGLALFDGTTARTVTLDLAAWDAGTEANSDLNSGFAGGQPDPAEGAANLDNGTATSEAIAMHAQFTTAQATLTVTPLMMDTPAAPAPAASGNAGLIDAGMNGGVIAAVGLAVLAMLVVAGRRLTARNRR